MHPDSYQPGRIPRCRGGGCRSRDYRIDKYRATYEVGPEAPKPCRCCGYSFPHRKGSLFCDHNPNLTEDDWNNRRRYA
jgi:hypothetical protein